MDIETIQNIGSTLKECLVLSGNYLSGMSQAFGQGSQAGALGTVVVGLMILFALNGGLVSNWKTIVGVVVVAGIVSVCLT